MTDTWTSWLWAAARGTYAAVLEHPFLTGLTDGTLAHQCFVHYLAQDVAYLHDYARTLAALAAKAPTHADTALLSRHAAETADVELTLHQTLLPALGIDPAAVAAIEVSPTTRAYTSYLLAVAHTGTFAEGLAAVLPCYWIYQRVGAELQRTGSPDPRYRRWIDTYGGPDFAATVADVLALADRIGPDLAADEARRAREHFATTARYEWMFWDAAWRQETWPV